MAVIEKCAESGWERPAHSASCSSVAHIMEAGMRDAFASVDREAAQRRRDAEVARARMIEANRPMIVPPVNGVIIEVVAPGTRILSGDERDYRVVTDETLVVKGGVVFVTQRHWDALVGSSLVLRVD